EKYANVLRFIAETGVDKDKIVETIQNFNDHEFGGGLKGMEDRDRKRNPGAKPKAASIPTDLSYSQKMKRDKLIKRAENADLNDDVFPASKPPEKLAYGQAVYKVHDGEMVIVGFKPWDQAEYENYLIRRARDVLKQEEKLQAKEDARQAALNADALNAMTGDGQQDEVAALIQAGVSKDAVQQAIAKAIAAMRVSVDLVEADPV
ncbi:MAG: hypothetical protein QM688_11180, partial [Sphingomonas bacterium]